MADLKLACRCGEVRGQVTSLTALFNNHLVCYCDDCQAFARHLEAQASALDEYGGTAIMQVSPKQVSIDAGAQQLRCLRLTPKGVTRWFTRCCNTPVANTVSAALPFNGIVTAFIDEPDSALGPVRYRIQGQHAINAPGDMRISPAFPRVLAMRIAVQMLLARMAGRHRPSPFYGSDAKPVHKPEVLNP